MSRKPRIKRYELVRELHSPLECRYCTGRYPDTRYDGCCGAACHEKARRFSPSPRRPHLFGECCTDINCPVCSERRQAGP